MGFLFHVLFNVSIQPFGYDRNKYIPLYIYLCFVLLAVPTREQPCVVEDCQSFDILIDRLLTCSKRHCECSLSRPCGVEVEPWGGAEAQVEGRRSLTLKRMGLCRHGRAGVSIKFRNGHPLKNNFPKIVPTTELAVISVHIDLIRIRSGIYIYTFTKKEA